jgi:crotonobetainyl-CoA:carnitine CoA-transferase CaiB-like acyl-CoA transferase
MGPFATQTLGDLGADVITVEMAGGDISRLMSSGPHPELSGVALNLLRNKRNIVLDIKQQGDHDILMRIAQTCDVVVTNMRPRALLALGIAYDDMVRARPDIVYCEAHGYPTDSPQADAPAYDDIIQSLSGLADVTRRTTGQPSLVPTILADKVCGLTIVYAVLAGLISRDRTGAGQRIEVPMIDVMRAFMLVEHGAAAIPRPVCGPVGYQRVLAPTRRPQKTADGWIVLLPYGPDQYAAFFQAAGRPDLVGDERCSTRRKIIENSEFLYSVLSDVASERPTAEWLAICAENDIPAAPVATLDDIVDSLPVVQHPVAGSYKSIPAPVRFSGTVPGDPRPAPLIGEHTAEILQELGVTVQDWSDAAGVGE